MALYEARHRVVAAEARELDLRELLGVEQAVEVAGDGDGFGNDGAGRVHGLPDTREVHASGDLLNQNWRGRRRRAPR